MPSIPIEEMELRDSSEVAWVYNFIQDYLMGNLPASPVLDVQVAFPQLVLRVMDWMLMLDERESDEDDEIENTFLVMMELITRDCDQAAGGREWVKEYNEKHYGPAQVSDLFGDEVVVVEEDDS